MQTNVRMSISSNIIEFEPAWVRFPKECPVQFIGKDTVFTGRGCHLYFLNLPSQQEHIYSVTGAHGDGVNCYAGHRQLPIFAFAEKCLKPRIMFIKYPDFQRIKVIIDGAPEGYSTMAFSDQEYFYTLSSLPVFEFVVWNWRTSEKLAGVETRINNIEQQFSCSYSTPLTVAQFNEKGEKIIIWEIQPSYKQCILMRRDIKMPHSDNIAGCIWNAEGQFFVLNNAGAIYILNPEYNLEFAMYGPKFTQSRQCFAWHKSGFFIAERNFGVKHVKKDGESIINYDTGLIEFHELISNGRDILVGWTTKSEIMELDTNENRFVLRKSLSNDLLQFCWLYPRCDNFVSLKDDYLTLTACNACTGKQESSIKMDQRVTIINSNPVYSYVLAALETGTLVFVSFHKVHAPQIMCKFRVDRNEIHRLVFTETGSNVVTGNTKLGLFFLLQVIPGLPIRLINFIEYQRPVLDFCVLDDKYHFKIVILVTTEEKPYISSKIVVKTVVKMSGIVKKKKYKSPTHNLRSIQVVDNVFYSSIFGKESACRFILHKKKIEFLSDINLNHYTSLVNLNCNSLHFFTYGFNGLIRIRDKSFKSEMFIVAHHRKDTGIDIVIADPFMRYTISRGRKGEIVGMKLLNHAVRFEKKYKETLRIMFEMDEKFSKHTIGFFPDEDVTYLEKKKAELTNIEVEKYVKEKKAIMDDFSVLKKEVVSLLNANLEGPELEKIDILEFYLHVKLREHREKMAELEAQWTIKYYNELIRAQTELWNYMKEKFWNTQLVKRSVIKGIFSNFEVENYGLIEEEPEAVNQLKYILMFREFEEILKAGDLFQPWIPASDEEIRFQLDKAPTICYKSESTRILEALQDLENEEENVVTKMETYPSSNEGEIMEKHMYYDQAEIHTYSQFAIQLQLTSCANRELRTMFNVKYDEMMQLKIKEMNSIIEKNNRLRFILSELKNNTICIEDPEWFLEEKPESIITVQDSEIPVRPYISPSRQAKLDWQAAEEERIRLLLLSDDFREKALIKMMDGVLEVRWEDTLKRDVPKPKCMLEKDPETYNEEDLRAIKDYEDKCTFLNIERQRYKNMLESEYGRTAEVVKETSKKFNGRLRDLLLTKIKTESTRYQHLLLLQLINNMMNKRADMKKNRNSIKEKIALNEKDTTALQENLSELNDALAECKANCEVLITKEKVLEKNFKKDYQEYSALVQEQGHRLYKRQPRMHLKNTTISTVIVELAVCCVTQEKSPLLIAECYDFLRSLDILDQYVGVPNTIDENMYKVICKHRRLKIENELKIKANQIEQSNIELSIQVYQKYINEKKEKNVKFTSDLQASRIDNLQFIHDKKIQLVVKRGLVEVPLTGSMTDFENAVMVNRKEVEYVNGLIMKAGERKIKVMTDKMVHRRQILMKEWHHKKMKMEIEDLKDYLCVVEKVKVTKEIQRYLRQRAKGEQFDKGLLTLDQEIECRKSIFEKTLNERQAAIKDLDRQVKEYKKSNKVLDQKIAEVNVDVCEQEGNRDFQFEQENEYLLKKRMGLIVRRSRLVKQIQDQHNEILILQTELELLRLKTYPTLKFKTL